MPLWGRFRAMAVARARKAARSSPPVASKVGDPIQIEISHVCGLQGFGRSIHDVCPACEFLRLVEMGVPGNIAHRAANLRAAMNLDIFPPGQYLDSLYEEFKELEREYGGKIPE